MPVAIPVRSRSVANLARDMELRRILRVQSSSAGLWCARLLWVVLPVSCGAAFADALDGWSSEPAAVAAALLWLAWAGGLLALFAPRPWGLTLLRVVAPLAVASAVATFASAGAAVSFLALGTTFIAAVFALSAPVNEAAGNALAYGDEVRVPLRVPTPLLLGPIPLGVLLLGACVATGPIALADGRVPLGVTTLVIGLPIAFAGVRSLHMLAKRWLVVVPAGLTLVDPLTLLDPVLIRRQQVSALHRAPGPVTASGVLDLRLGTLPGSIEIECATAIVFARRKGRAGGDMLEREAVRIAVVRADALLAFAATRRLHTS
jgi:hypothetical protein